jgi:peptidyl-tRNA hydrolase, PTH1 family
MLVFAGLGNPGPAYARHRHNVGFRAVEAIHQRHRFAAWRARFQSLAAEGVLGDARVLLLKPQTYMNESGRAVGQALRYHRLGPESLVVLHDELDLAPGRLRVKTGGGVAGHNGLRSIAAHLGTRDFKRVRLGIGHPGDKSRVTPHVLGDFAVADRAWLEPLLDAFAEAAPLLASGDDAGFMNRVALLTRPPDRPGPKAG